MQQIPVSQADPVVLLDLVADIEAFPVTGRAEIGLQVPGISDESCSRRELKIVHPGSA